jgi:UDPglucose--hexose-1-phosphate uridylyltransferase
VLVWDQHPHRRLNPLTREWVLVSPQRANRPWQGEIEALPSASSAPYDPACYLCPGNPRANGQRNPTYSATFAFDNDFPALLPQTPLPYGHGSEALSEPRAFSEPRALASGLATGILVAEPERGLCRVVCFSPRHDLTLSRMPLGETRAVVEAGCEESTRLGALPFITAVTIFENRGFSMGASNPHPHCQIWANQTLPNELATEHESQRQYLHSRGRCLLCDYLAAEAGGERLIFENSSVAVIVPFWAVWPFETIVIGKRHTGAIEQLTPRERDDLAEALKRLTTRYDNLFETPFPYTMGFHQRPCDGQSHDSFHLHAHFYPPLLRSATVRKFMVGYEMLAAPQRDITPEAAAERLRASSELHYLDDLAPVSK